MLSRLVQALVESKNEAADEVLLEALRAGNEAEKALALNALFRRGTLKALSGVEGVKNATVDAKAKTATVDVPARSRARANRRTSHFIAAPGRGSVP